MSAVILLLHRKPCKTEKNEQPEKGNSHQPFNNDDVERKHKRKQDENSEGKTIAMTSDGHTFTFPRPFLSDLLSLAEFEVPLPI